MRKSISLLISALFICGGCRVGPRYVAPSPEVPQGWKASPTEEANAPYVDFWWQVFDDPDLDRLEMEAVANNPSLYVALERVVEARAMTGREAANLYPQVTFNPSFLDTGTLFEPFIPSGLLGGTNSATTAATPCRTAASTASTKIAPFRIHQFQYMLPMNLSYELDLWGKLRDRYDAARFNAEAEADSYYGSLLTLTADLATSYFQLRALDAEVALLEANIQTRLKNYELTHSRYNKGLVNYLDVTQAEVDLGNVKASLDDTTRLRALAENQIAILIGAIPSDFHLQAHALKKTPPVIPAGIPSTILMRRPDIAQAERSMASEHALIGAAYASFFPSFSLTAALGFSSPDISQFLKWIGRYWMLGADMSQMVFDGGRDCADLKIAIARFRQASGSYQQQVLTAFQEVEDALTNIAQYTKQADNLQEVVRASKKATAISMNRYVNGVSIYLEVMENERLELQAEVNWINVLNLRYAATVQLIKALGGGWGDPQGCVLQ